MATQAPAKPAPINPTPKWRFLQSPANISKHRAMIDSPEFQMAIDYAQMQYIRFMSDGHPANMTDPNLINASAMAMQRIQGMQDFITVLRGLSEVPPPPTPKPTDNLS